MGEKQQIILNTCPDHATAKKIAELLVGKSLAACVNIVPGIESVYRWKEKIESDQEHLLVIKAQTACYAAIEQAILQYHPSELPEIIAVPLNNGLPAYLNWINDNSHTNG